jgi:DNA invertase Pin-like site-specific DNA recombinase
VPPNQNRYGHSTALFAAECQSFLDNVIAGLGQIGSWNNPHCLRGWFQRGFSLGLEAQKAAVRGYLGAKAPIAEFTEIETERRNDRPQLKEALTLCRKRKAKLVIAKLGRLSRNLAFIATLMDSGVEFVAVDNPHATRLTLHILAAVAEHEREMIADRTKAKITK